MFSGIVESKVALLDWSPVDPSIPNLAARIKIQKPQDFNDLSVGDSIAVNGVCLTVEAFDNDLQFFLGAETLKVTGWSKSELLKRPINLERSLAFNGRVHGHFVTGHVDGLGRVIHADYVGSNFQLRIEIQRELSPLIWRKGSVAVNGVSLTVNAVEDLNSGATIFDVGLIPETLNKTNLGELKSGDLVNIEVDQMARAMQRKGEL